MQRCGRDGKKHLQGPGPCYNFLDREPLRIEAKKKSLKERSGKSFFFFVFFVFFWLFGFFFFFSPFGVNRRLREIGS